MTILGCPKDDYRKKIRKAGCFLIAGAVAVIGLNAILTALRTDATHAAFLALNIVSDVVLVWIVTAVLLVRILPRQRVLALYERGERNGGIRSGAVIRIAEKSVCVQGFSCRAVTFSGEDGESELYLIGNELALEVNARYDLGVVENLIYRAEESP